MEDGESGEMWEDVRDGGETAGSSPSHEDHAEGECGDDESVCVGECGSGFMLED